MNKRDAGGTDATTGNNKPQSTPTPAVLQSGDLFAHATELMIEHAGELYRLRITKNRKLILTK